MTMSTAATPPNALPSEELCGNLIGGAKSTLKDKKVNNKH